MQNSGMVRMGTCTKYSQRIASSIDMLKPAILFLLFTTNALACVLVCNDFDRVTKLTYADTAFETFEYESANGGKLLRSMDRAGRLTEYSFDNAGRVTQKLLHDDGNRLSPSAVVAYSYDGNDGRPTGETFNGSTVSRSYDARGRLTSISVNGQSVDYTYNDDDTMASKRVSGYAAETYSYDAFGRMTGYAGPGGNATFRIDAKGRIDQVALPNNVTRTYTFDAAGRALTTVQNVDGLIQSTGSDYDSTGRLTKLNVTDSAGADWLAQFSYDGAGRLNHETRTGFGTYDKTYTYDNNDNRTSLTVALPTGESESSTYTYNALNQLLQIQGANAASYQQQFEAAIAAPENSPRHSMQCCRISTAVAAWKPASWSSS